MTLLTDKAARFCLDPHRRQEHLMIERGLGYWISPNGEFIPTPPRASHADLIRVLIDQNTLDDEQRDAFTADANTFALAQGWTRVRIYPTERVVYADLGQCSDHLPLVEQLLDQLALTGYHVKYTDESGGYVSPRVS